VSGPRWLAAALALVVGWTGPGAGQNHPELDWQVLETEHFRVFYHQDLDAVARQVAGIAEQAYEPVTGLYGYRPGGPVRIVLRGYDDYANGAAYYYQDKIEIWTTALDHDFDLRGTSDWLRNVVTHEFTHLVSLGAARKAPQWLPSAYLQVFAYQREKHRPDILVGYPDVLVSYPVLGTVVPMWFAEGVAQYQVEGARHDRWDTHRDMVLRTRVLADRALSWDELGSFGKAGFGNEYVYDHGLSLVAYIAAQYGEERLAALMRAAASRRHFSFEPAVREVLGISGPQLHADWLASQRARYQAQVAALGPLHAGELVADVGFSNVRPAVSPSGDRLAYLSTQEQHYGPHALVLRELSSGAEEVLVTGVTSTVSWAPDGRQLAYVQIGRADPYGSRHADVCLYDLDVPAPGLGHQALWAVPAALSGYRPRPPAQQRLSHGLRALYPAFSPDGAWVAFVRNSGGSNNLGLMRRDGSQLRYLTDFRDGTQLYAPQWAPDGSRLVLSVARGAQRDIATIRVDTAAARTQLAAVGQAAPAPAARLELLVQTPGTDRDPVYTPDGQAVVFSSDVSGIFNLYALELASGAVRQLTNVAGGAFYPTVSAAGDVYYSGYTVDGFRIFRVGLGDQVDAAGASPAGSSLRAAFAGGLRPGETLAAEAAAPPGALAASPYGVDFLPSAVMPRLSLDEGRFKPGLYLSSGDALERQDVLVGLAVAPAHGDRDVFALYEYRGWRPTVFLEAAHQRRVADRADSSAARDLIVTGVDYHLLQGTVGVKGRLGRSAELALSATYDRYDASVHSDVFVPRTDGTVGFVRRRQRPYGYTYLHGFDLGLTYQFRRLDRRRDEQINPRGRELQCRLDRFHNYFISGFDEDATFLEEEYARLFYNQLTADWHEYVGLPWNSTLGLRFYGGWIASSAVDDREIVNDFFDFHLGGLNFMKGYTYYSIEGRKAAMAGATWRFPLATQWGWRARHLYFDQAFGALYADIGKAWDGRWDERDRFFGRRAPLRDVGAQVRCDVISYYAVPTRVQVDVAYGIDEVEGRSPWKWYLTVLFSYLERL